MADLAQRRPRRLIRVAVAVLVALLLAGAVLWEFLPGIIERVAIARLTEMGVPAPALTLRRIGLDGATLTDVRLGEADELTAREIGLRYTLPDLFDGRLEAITIRGASIRGSVGPDGISFGSLDPLFATSGDGGAIPDLPPIRLEDARGDLATPLGQMGVSGDGTVTIGEEGVTGAFDLAVLAPQGTSAGTVELTVRDGIVDAALRLADGKLSLPGLLGVTAAGDASLRVAEGGIAALSGVFALGSLVIDQPRAADLGPLKGTLTLGREDGLWRADLALAESLGDLAGILHLSTPDLDPDGRVTAALDLEAGTAAPVWPLLGLPSPDSGSTRISVLSEFTPSELLAGEISALPDLGGHATLEIDGLAYRGIADAISLVAGFDVTLSQDIVRLDSPAPLLADATLAPALLQQVGMPASLVRSFSGPMSVTLTLAEPVSIELAAAGPTVHGGFDATIALADGEPLLDLAAANAAFISGSAGLSYDLPDVDAQVSLPEALAEELKMPDGRIAVAGRLSGNAGAGAHHTEAVLSVDASASRLAALGFDARDPSAHLPLTLSLADGQLRLGLSEEGAIAAKRLAGPTPLTIDGAVRLPLRAAEAPVLTIDLRPAEGWLATLDLTAGPLRLAGSIDSDHGPIPGEIALPRLRLTGNHSGGAWSGKLRAAGGTAGLPGYEVAATGIDLTVDLAADQPPRIALDAAFAQTGDSPYVIPLTAKIAAREIANGWAFSGTAKDTFDRISLTIDGRHDLRRGTGSAMLKLAPIEFIPNVRQPADVAPWLAGVADEVSGSVALAGDVSWDRETIASKLELAIRDLSATTGAAVIERINGVIELDGLLPFTTPPGQTVAVALIDVGIPLTDGLLTFRVAPGPKLEIAGGTLHLAGGRVDAEPLTLDPAASRSEAVLLVERIDLGELLALAGVDGLTGEGHMSGRIPIAIENGDVIITGGVFDADAPGVLRYAPLAPPAALQGQGETVSLALSALTNFQYQALRLTVDRQAGGEMLVGMHVTGNNPDFYDGYPVEFNLNVSGALDQVLRQGLAGYRIPETIQERLEEFAQ